MPVAILAVVRLRHVSLLPKDDEINTFAFASSGSDVAAESANLDVPLEHMYTTVGTGTHPLGWYLDTAIDRSSGAHHAIDYYDITAHLDGSNHGSPVRSVAWSMNTGASAGTSDRFVPAENGAVITLLGAGRRTAAVLGGTEAIPTPHRAQAMGAPATHAGRAHPKARRTGRIYVGPASDRMYEAIGGEVRIADLARADLLAAGVDLVTAVDLVSPSMTWAVWSRRDAVLYDLEGIQVDNAPDIQRRRGVASTARSLATF